MDERAPTILCVDDEPELLEVLVDYLRSKGVEARGARDGEEALRQIQGFRPSIVLLDVAMPRMTGVEVLKRIKTLPQETAVIMVSGIEDADMAKQTLAMGAADYVTKPLDFPYLDTVLETYLVMAQP